MMNRHERRRRRKYGADKDPRGHKVIELSADQLHEIADVILFPEKNRTVTVEANERGQLALGKVFPDITAPWAPPSEPEFPDWKKATWLDVPNLERNTRHALPPIYGDTILDEAEPNAIAFVLGCAMKNQGARVMIIDISENLEIRDCMLLIGNEN